MSKTQVIKAFLFALGTVMISGTGYAAWKITKHIEIPSEPIQRTVEETSRNLTSLPAQEKTPTTRKENIESEIDTSDWKTYRNEEYFYKVKYPVNFYLDETNSRNIFIGTDLVHRKPNGVFIKVLSRPIEEEIGILKKRDELTTVLEEKEIYLGNINAVRLILSTAIGYDELYYFIRKDGLEYELLGLHDNAYHKAIISTFRFY